METVEALRRKIAGAGDLLSVVKTMKALSAVNIRHYERAVETLVEYNRTVEMGLHILLGAQDGRRVTESVDQSRRWGAIVFGSDQGLCGHFNERIIRFSIDEVMAMQSSRDECRLISVGERAALLLQEAGQPPVGTFKVPGGISGITPLVQDLLLQVEYWRLTEEIGEIVLFHNRPLSGTLFYPRITRLLPLDLNWLRGLQSTPWPSRVLPTFTMDWDALFSALVRQHLFVALYRTCAESLASEDASRLAAMQNAEHNIEERLIELNRRYHHQRQDSITAELLDIIGGYEAVLGTGF